MKAKAHTDRALQQVHSHCALACVTLWILETQKTLLKLISVIIDFKRGTRPNFFLSVEEESC